MLLDRRGFIKLVLASSALAATGFDLDLLIDKMEEEPTPFLKIGTERLLSLEISDSGIPIGLNHKWITGGLVESLSISQEIDKAFATEIFTKTYLTLEIRGTRPREWIEKIPHWSDRRPLEISLDFKVDEIRHGLVLTVYDAELISTETGPGYGNYTLEILAHSVEKFNNGPYSIYVF